MYKRYLIAYGIFLVPLLTPLITNYVYLEKAGEYMPLSEIVAEQRAQPFCLYGSGVHSDFFHYKLEGYRQTKPDVAVIGSSRVMQLRQEFFADSLYNLGGSITSVDTAEHITNLMLREHIPKVIIIGLDYWWFLEESRFPVKTLAPPKEKQRRHLSSLILPLSWFKRGRLSVSTYTDVLLHGREAAAGCRIGVRAIHENSGFNKDGAHYYSFAYKPDAGGELAYDRFAEAREWVTTGENVYRHFQTVREDQVERFIRLIEHLQERGIEVVVFVPPLPPQMLAAIAEKPNEYAYLPRLFSLFQNKGFPFYNFHDTQSLGSNDCEFLDEAHGDHIAFARILLAMVRGKSLTSRLDTEELQRVVRTAAPPFTNDLYAIRCEKIQNGQIRSLQGGEPK
ncbi:hypothetical protein COU76_02145 [Candidatus Peregrinibacteria bacterium CG10_big_fil_rev_8_21_14_0_10_49_10]|nr:MAG: hypothetical protein COU76_02145 [Candidatus Peregrinibacteria bacterium CG10_big_fil_rev_8_21_14_0_10_49_10]